MLAVSVETTIGRRPRTLITTIGRRPRTIGRRPRTVDSTLGLRASTLAARAPALSTSRVGFVLFGLFNLSRYSCS